MVPPGSIFGVIPLWVGVYLAAAVGFALAGKALYQRVFRPIMLGKKDEKRFDHPIKRAWGVVLVVLGQRRVLQSVSFKWKDMAGIGHALIFWGFVSMVVSYILFIFLDSIRPWISGYILTPGGLKFFFWWMDIVAIVVLTAIAWAAVRRWLVKPGRLANLRSWEPAIILLFITSLMVFSMLTGIMEVAAAKAGAVPVNAATTAYSESTPIVGNLGRLLADAGFPMGAADTLHGLFYWVHYLIILSFGVYIPFSKHMHMMASPLNVFFRSLEPRGAIIPIKDIEKAEVWGAKRPHDFSWKELLDGYACAVCGRCTFNCPANISGKPLSPMDLIEHVKHNLLAVGPELAKNGKTKEEKDKITDAHPLFDDKVTEEWVWNCVTCAACEQECPVMVEHIDTIIDLRRNLVMTEAKMPPTAEQTLRSMETRGHPWRGTQFSRTDWTKGLNVKVISNGGEVDVLFWVGCTPALEERSQKTAQAMARVLERAGVNFAILGVEESCNGDPARRIGNEYLFKMLAEQNIEALKKYKFKTILTTCPHCFNTLRNEYPQFGGQFEVEHYATYIKKLLDQGKLKMGKPIQATLTYHDSCYLGRHNGVYEEPRQIIEAIPGIKLKEVPLRNREHGYCCGAGGGHMWVEESSGKRINHVRSEQILETNPDLVGVSCPFCLQMFKEGIESKGVKDKVKEVDVIELIDQATQS